MITHLLKCQVQPKHRTRSWRAAIIAQRAGIARLLDQNPSVRTGSVKAISNVYRTADRIAAETGLPEGRFPADCTFTSARILDADFLP